MESTLTTHPETLLRNCLRQYFVASRVNIALFIIFQENDVFSCSILSVYSKFSVDILNCTVFKVHIQVYLVKCVPFTLFPDVKMS